MESRPVLEAVADAVVAVHREDRVVPGIGEQHGAGRDERGMEITGIGTIPASGGGGSSVQSTGNAVGVCTSALSKAMGMATNWNTTGGLRWTRDSSAARAMLPLV